VTSEDESFWDDFNFIKSSETKEEKNELMVLTE
jgi:hypothetical protein